MYDVIYILTWHIHTLVSVSMENMEEEGKTGKEIIAANLTFSLAAFMFMTYFQYW